MIAQNAMENDLELFANDKHFELMAEVHPLKLY
jgi:predicted nucleic acid-binding protein